MSLGTLYFVLRGCLIVAVSAYVWCAVQPRTPSLRILRAGLLVLGLLMVYTLLRVAEL